MQNSDPNTLVQLILFADTVNKVDTLSADIPNNIFFSVREYWAE